MTALRTFAGWLALFALGAALGLLAARVRLFDSPWAGAALVVLVMVLIGYGIHAAVHMWDEDD